MFLNRAAEEASRAAISDWMEWRRVVEREREAPKDVRARVSSSIVAVCCWGVLVWWVLLTMLSLLFCGRSKGSASRCVIVLILWNGRRRGYESACLQ